MILILNGVIAVASILPLFHPLSRSSSALKRVKSVGVLLPLFLSCLASNFVFYAFEQSFFVNFFKSIVCLILMLALERWGFCRSCSLVGAGVKISILSSVVIDGIMSTSSCDQWLIDNYVSILQWITTVELVIAAAFNMALLLKNDRA